MHWTHELGSVRAPAHAFWNRQCGQGLVYQFRHQFNGGTAFLDGAIDYPGALVGFHRIKLVRCHAQGGGEAGQCPGGVAGIVERSFHGRAAFFHRFVRLSVFQVPYPDGKPAWCGKSFHFAELNTGLFQAIGNATGKRVRQWLEGLGRQLFSAQFDQKILFCHDYAFPCSC